LISYGFDRRGAWSGVFVIGRIVTMTIAAAAFLFGLPKLNTEDIPVGFGSGNFNTLVIRLPLFTAIIGISLYQTWQFIAFQMHLRHETIARQEAANKERQQQRERKKNRREQDARKRKNKEEETETKAAVGTSSSGDTALRKVGGQK
jgi:hypothetical protein